MQSGAKNSRLNPSVQFQQNQNEAVDQIINAIAQEKLQVEVELTKKHKDNKTDKTILILLCFYKLFVLFDLVVIQYQM